MLSSAAPVPIIRQNRASARRTLHEPQRRGRGKTGSTAGYEVVERGRVSRGRTGAHFISRHRCGARRSGITELAARLAVGRFAVDAALLHGRDVNLALAERLRNDGAGGDRPACDTIFEVDDHVVTRPPITPVRRAQGSLGVRAAGPVRAQREDELGLLVDGRHLPLPAKGAEAGLPEGDPHAGALRGHLRGCQREIAPGPEQRAARWGGGRRRGVGLRPLGVRRGAFLLNLGVELRVGVALGVRRRASLDGGVAAEGDEEDSK